MRICSTAFQGHPPCPSSRSGSCDSHLTSLVALHIRSLLPPGAADMDIPHSIEVACLVSLGLLHMASGSRHLVDVMLKEIGGHEEWVLREEQCWACSMSHWCKCTYIILWYMYVCICVLYIDLYVYHIVSYTYSIIIHMYVHTYIQYVCIHTVRTHGICIYVHRYVRMYVCHTVMYTYIRTV